MKYIKSKHILAFSLLTVAADSSVANFSSSISISKNTEKSNPARPAEIPRYEKIKKSNKFKEKNKINVGYDTQSLSEFFRRLRQEKES